MNGPVEISEKQWQARYDASTLSDAEVIKADPARLQAAKDAAATLAEEKGKEKKAMDKVARTPGKRTPSPTSPKSGQAPTKQKNAPTTGGTVGKPGTFNVFNKLPKG